MTLTYKMAFEICPLVAILRGVAPDEVEEVGEALVAAGIRIIEVPLNSPDPFASIAILAKVLRDRAIVGAGTVLRVSDVEATQRAGGALIVSPHTDPLLIAKCVEMGLAVLPGVSTASEAMAALAAGATGLKLFPAETSSPAWIKAIRAVAPPATAILPVGGIEPAHIAQWRDAGASGFGLGSGLYRPGMTDSQVGERARAYVAAWTSASQSA